jgi:hypothetical protein
MRVIDEISYWFDLTVWLGVVVLQLWALGDCSSRKAAAFTAVDRLTKPAWMAILIVAGVITVAAWQTPILGLIAVVAASVYLVDVRPAIREITGR